MRSLVKGILTCLLISTFFSCYKDNEEELYPNTSACDTSSVTYSANILSIIQNNCYACHNNANSGSIGAGISFEGHANLSTYINNNKTRFLGAVEHSSGYSKMPKGGNKLSDCSITLIKKWINDGIQNN